MITAPSTERPSIEERHPFCDEPRKFLFICNQNRCRNPAAEHIFANIAGINTMSARCRGARTVMLKLLCQMSWSNGLTRYS
jgi:hypothetical protein